jgi:exonuclease SbcD
LPSRLRFLQISDVHLGQTLVGSRLAFPAEKAAEREREILAAMEAAFQLVGAEELDGVLLPGDLFNGEEVGDSLAAEAFAIIRSIAPKPVFLSPGNHDPYSPEGPYGAARWRLLAGGEGPPENLVLFREERFRTVPWPGRPEVTVTGAAFLRPTPVLDRRLALPVVDRASLDPARINLALLHGSWDDSGWLARDKATLPFSAAELAAQPFDYTAVGHYHAWTPIHRPGTREIIGAYAGMPAFQALDEEGPKSVLIVEVRREDGGGSPCNVVAETRAVDERRLLRLTVDLTGRDDLEQVRAAVEGAWAAAGGRPTDVAAVTFTGRLAAGLAREDLIAATAEWLAGRSFHAVAFGGRLEPELDVRPYLEGEATTLEARFARELHERIRSLPPGRDREVVRHALYYGLEALVHGKVRRRWEADPGEKSDGGGAPERSAP